MHARSNGLVGPAVGGLKLERARERERAREAVHGGSELKNAKPHVTLLVNVVFLKGLTSNIWPRALHFLLVRSSVPSRVTGIVLAFLE